MPIIASGKHAQKSAKTDQEKILKELLEAKVFVQLWFVWHQEEATAIFPTIKLTQQKTSSFWTHKLDARTSGKAVLT